MSEEALRRITALKDAGRYEAALRELSPVAAAAREGVDVVFGIKASLEESNLLGIVGDHDLAIARATWAISQAHSPKHAATLAEHAWDVTMTFLLFANAASEHEQIPIQHVLRVLDEAELFLERIGRPSWRCGVQSERGALFARHRRFEEAAESDRAALDGKLRDPRAPGHSARSIQRSLARSLTELGRLDEAAEVLEDLLRQPNLLPLDELAAHTYLGHNALKRGLGPLAATCADNATRLARTMSPKQRMAAAGLSVEAYLAVDRLSDARAAADEIMRCAEAVGTAHAWCSAYQDAFDVALREGDVARATELLDRMEEWAKKVDARIGDTHRMDLVLERRAKLARR